MHIKLLIQFVSAAKLYQDEVKLVKGERGCLSNGGTCLQYCVPGGSGAEATYMLWVVISAEIDRSVLT